MCTSFPRLIVLAVLAVLATSVPTLAQMQPVDELASYKGLHAAAAKGDAAEIARLIATGARLEARDPHKRTPLHVAFLLRKQEAAEALIKGGADVKALEMQKYDMITIAAVNNDLPMLRLALASGGDPKAVTSPYDGTALIAAAHLGHAEVVRVLIAAGAPLDHVNNLKWTAALEAVMLGDGGAGHVETIEALVKAGANVNIADDGGMTPLAHARARKYDAMVRILEAAGAK